MTENELVGRMFANDGELTLKFLKSLGLLNYSHINYVSDFNPQGKNYIFFRNSKYLLYIYVCSDFINVKRFVFSSKRCTENKVFRGDGLKKFYASVFGGEYVNLYSQKISDMRKTFVYLDLNEMDRSLLFIKSCVKTPG